jgi:hypothetical protein
MFRCLGHKQDGNLLERTTKLHGRGCFIAQHRHLGPDKRMLEQMNVAGWRRFTHRDDLNRAAFAGEAKSRTTATQINDEKTPECNGVIP